MNVGRFWVLGVPFALACVNGGDDSTTKPQGSLGGPCFANNTCNAGLSCVLENGSGICEQPDATVDAPANETGGDATTDQTTQDAPADVVVDTGSDACNPGFGPKPICSNNCGNDECCAQNGQCYTSTSCSTSCNGQPCWKCTGGCGAGEYCCSGNSVLQPTCPAQAQIASPGSCSTTCQAGLFVCVTTADCPPNMACIPATVSGLNVGAIGVCQ